MTELTDSFVQVDQEAYEYMLAGVQLLQQRIWDNTFRNTDERRIENLEQWLAAVYAGKWPGVRPFDNGFQFAAWQECNCHCCKRDVEADQNKPPTCPILYAVGKAYIGYGLVSEEIARRMGYLDHQGYYVWECGEVEWTEVRKAEVAARQEAGHEAISG